MFNLVFPTIPLKVVFLTIPLGEPMQYGIS